MSGSNSQTAAHLGTVRHTAAAPPALLQIRTVSASHSPWAGSHVCQARGLETLQPVRPTLAKSATRSSGSTIIRWQSRGLSVTGRSASTTCCGGGGRGREAAVGLPSVSQVHTPPPRHCAAGRARSQWHQPEMLRTRGPMVMLGTKRPSMTSTWIQSQPALSIACTCSPSLEKLALRGGGGRGAVGCDRAKHGAGQADGGAAMSQQQGAHTTWRHRRWRRRDRRGRRHTDAGSAPQDGGRHNDVILAEGVHRHAARLRSIAAKQSSSSEAFTERRCQRTSGAAPRQLPPVGGRLCKRVPAAVAA